MGGENTEYGADQIQILDFPKSLPNTLHPQSPLADTWWFAGI